MTHSQPEFIPFNRPFLTGKETAYIEESVRSGKISGDGIFTKKCHHFFEDTFKFKKVLLTTSCTDALEMAAILLDIKPGDEIILPSFTFVSTVNSFLLRGAKPVFCDSSSHNPNIDASQLEALITPRTRAIIPVHYAGIACDMDAISDLTRGTEIAVIEDAAQAIDSYHRQRPLGSIGNMGAFSFHETKNIISGEGGLLAINEDRFIQRAEIIREKGTNRTAFFRGDVDKYGWVDIGSSFLPSDIIAAFLFAQLENLENIQAKRRHIWNTYMDSLLPLQMQGLVTLPHIPSYATNNAHMFYVVTDSLATRTRLLAYLKSRQIGAVFHYQSLHRSPYFREKYHGKELPHANRYSDCLVRLPFFLELTTPQQQRVIDAILEFYNEKQTSL